MLPPQAHLPSEQTEHVVCSNEFTNSLTDSGRIKQTTGGKTLSDVQGSWGSNQENKISLNKSNSDIYLVRKKFISVQVTERERIVKTEFFLPTVT